MLVMLDSKKLKDKRTEKNLSQEKLAELCNTSERYIRDLEAGRKNNPSAALVFQFSDILDVPMHELMQKKED